MNWFTPQDKLAGSIAHNLITDDGTKSWSMDFSSFDFDQFLFSKNDFSEYAIVSKHDVYVSTAAEVTALKTQVGTN